MLSHTDPLRRAPVDLPGVGDLHLLSAGRRWVDSGWTTLSTYRGPAHAAMLCHRGEASVSCDGNWTVLRPGTVTIVPGHRHLRRRTSGFEHTWVVFSCVALTHDLQLSRTPAVLTFPTDGWWTAAMAAAAAWQPGAAPDLARAARLESLLLGVVACLAEAAGPLPAAAGGDLVRRAVAWLDEHYRERPTVGDLAQAVGCSANHLHTRFAAAVGLTPAAYAEQRRLRDAQHLLLEGQGTVQEIATQCGYDDPFHFSRVFRRHFGCPPRELRTAIWGP